MLHVIVSLLIAVSTLAAQSSQILILHKAGSALGFYSADGRFETQVPVGLHPHEMVRSADGHYIYTTNNGTMAIEVAGPGGNTISIVDIRARKKVGDISLGRYHRPHGIDLNPKTGLVYVTTENPDQLLVVDPRERKIVKTYAVKGKTAHMVKLGPEARWAYVSLSNSKSVSAVNLATGEVKLISTGERPEGSALSPDGKRLYVVNREAAQISVIDTEKQELVQTILTGKGPVRVKVVPDGKELVYALFHDNAVGFADVATGKQGKVLPLGAQPVSLDLSGDGRLAYTSAQDDDTVYVISVADRKVVGTIKTPAGAHPDPVMVIP